MSFKYDPQRRIDPERWLAHSEAERIEAATSYHRKRALGGPNLVAHATFHVVVENQVALGAATPVQATLARLVDRALIGTTPCMQLGLFSLRTSTTF